jgi:hypothetical protein
VDVLVHHLIELFLALNPVVFNGIWQTAEDVDLVRESNPISLFRKTARFRRKLAQISALTVLPKNGRLARFAQINAL